MDEDLTGYVERATTPQMRLDIFATLGEEFTELTIKEMTIAVKKSVACHQTGGCRNLKLASPSSSTVLTITLRSLLDDERKSLEVT